MRLTVLAALALLASAASAGAQIPVFHGPLDIQPGRAIIDPETGDAVLKARRWRFRIAPTSNGLFPDREPVLVSVGATSYPIAAGALRASRSGKSFTYRAPRGTPAPAVKLLRLRLRRDGWYGVELTLTGVDLARMIVEDPICLPTVLIVGDDDGFAGVSFTRRSFRTRRVKIPSDCDTGSWPWL